MKKKFTGKSGTAWWYPNDRILDDCPNLWRSKWPGMVRVRWTIKPITNRKARK